MSAAQKEALLAFDKTMNGEVFLKEEQGEGENTEENGKKKGKKKKFTEQLKDMF